MEKFVSTMRYVKFGGVEKHLSAIIIISSIHVCALIGVDILAMYRLYSSATYIYY